MASSQVGLNGPSSPARNKPEGCLGHPECHSKLGRTGSNSKGVLEENRTVVRKQTCRAAMEWMRLGRGHYFLFLLGAPPKAERRSCSPPRKSLVIGERFVRVERNQS